MSKEIQPEEIWNKESQEKIKKHILNLAKKQTPKDRLKTELMAKKYTSEDYATKIMEVAYYNFPLVYPKETISKAVTVLLEEYTTQCQQDMDKKYTEEDVLKYAWFLVENIGQYACDKTANFEGKYLEQFKNKQD